MVGVAATALMIAVVLGATRVLGRPTASPRTNVVSYIKAVDAVQEQMHAQLLRSEAAYTAFQTANAGEADVSKLASAQRTLRTLARRLADLPAPPQARKLRKLLLDLVHGEITVAKELTALAVFLPRFDALTASVQARSTTLSRALAAAAAPKPQTIRGTAKQIAAARSAYTAAADAAATAQARAVDAFDRALGHLAVRLRRLTPPALVAPAYRAELRTLTATQKAGAALAAGLRKQDRSPVPELSRNLLRGAHLAGSLAAQRSEIAALKAYNERAHRLATAQARVQKEAAKLRSEFG